MKLIITIDTEEDNWGHYSPTEFTLSNIARIPAFQSLLDEFNARPTYLITYPVAADKECRSILKAISDDGRCEIGAHCHPWNTPPFEEETNARNSMMLNLPTDLQFRKLTALRETIHREFGKEPVSFRTGRWGYGPEVARNLRTAGYRIDTSITPYTDWREDHGPDFSECSPHSYRFSANTPFEESIDGELIEIPATIAYFQKHFTLCNTLLRSLSRPPMRILQLHRIFRKLGLLNRVWLSPEVADAESMIRLTRRMMKNGYRLVNLFFHSPSLKHGLTPFVRSAADEARFLKRVRDYLAFARESGIECIPLSESVHVVH